jgi:hypothetical protein
MQNLRRRLKALERLRRDHDETFTLEDLCRVMWRTNKTNFMKRVEKGDWPLRHFVRQFQFEDPDALPK